MGGRAADLIFYALILMLPVSALIARQVPIGRTLKMLAVWIAIFAIGLLLVGQRDRLDGSKSGSDPAPDPQRASAQSIPTGLIFNIMYIIEPGFELAGNAI